MGGREDVFDVFIIDFCLSRLWRLGLRLCLVCRRGNIVGARITVGSAARGVAACTAGRRRAAAGRSNGGLSGIGIDIGADRLNRCSSLSDNNRISFDFFNAGSDSV